MMPVGYGLSETCAFFCSHWWSTPRELLKLSMGKLLPGNQLRVVDPESGRTLGVGEDGELAIKGPTLMQRYLGRSPEECVDADGFFHTGDAGHVDADGYVHFSGRRTEMIKTGRRQRLPRRARGAAAGLPAGEAGPRRRRARPPARPDRRGLHHPEGRRPRPPRPTSRAFLRERVAAYKVPKRVLFFDDGEIPMTSSDTKVRDDALVALVERRLATDPVPTTSGDR